MLQLKYSGTEQGAQENIRIKEGLSAGRLVKTA
jgi:hypothetical protein